METELIRVSSDSSGIGEFWGFEDQIEAEAEQIVAEAEQIEATSSRSRPPERPRGSPQVSVEQIGAEMVTGKAR